VLAKKLLVFYLLVWFYLAIEPVDRFDWLLDNLLIILFVPTLAYSYRYFRFSDVSYVLITVFLLLAAVGAHYAYTFTPVGEWLKELMGFSRNHYDRIVHFAFGLLLVYPLQELLVRVVAVPVKWSYVLAPLLIVSFSALFEVAEAIVAELVNPELGIMFLGAQGDIWDAQKDIILSLFGAMLTMAIAYRLSGKSGRDFPDRR